MNKLIKIQNDWEGLHFERDHERELDCNDMIDEFLGFEDFSYEFLDDDFIPIKK